MPIPSAQGDLLYGCKSIAAFLGVKERQALRLTELNSIPVFREGKIICSSRSELSAWMARRRAQARATAQPTTEAAKAAAESYPAHLQSVKETVQK